MVWSMAKAYVTKRVIAIILILLSPHLQKEETPKMKTNLYPRY